MSLLSIVQNAMLANGLEPPSAVYSNSDQTVKEYMRLAQVEGDTLSREADWNSLKVVGSLTGDGTSTVFDLPSDFHRFMTGERMWRDKFPTHYLTRVTDDEMRGLQVSEVEPIYPVWRLIGSQIEFYPAPETSDVIFTEYRTTHWIMNVDLTARYLQWQADTNVAIIPERLITMGTSWRWKRMKGFPFEDERAEYEMQKAREIAANSPRPILRQGRRLASDTLSDVVTSFVPNVTA